MGKLARLIKRSINPDTEAVWESALHPIYEQGWKDRDGAGLCTLCVRILSEVKKIQKKVQGGVDVDKLNKGLEKIIQWAESKDTSDD